MPAPTLHAQGTANAVTSGNLAITLPTYAANDIVVITTVGYVPNTTTGANTQSLSSPWTKNSPDVTVTTGGVIDEEHACWWARATSASSLGTSVTITRPTSWDTGTDTCWGGRAYVIRGCATTGNPFDEFASTAVSTAANPALPAITVSGGNRLALVFMTKADNTATPTAATGYTVGTQATDTTGTDCAFQTYRQTASANVATVTPTGGTAPAQGNSVYFEFSFIPESVTATASAPLGALTPTATATVQELATASAVLGGVTATATAAIRKTATADAPLGSLTATASAEVRARITATGSALLGALDATSSATVSHPATADAPLGSLTASATAQVEKTVTATASAPLGAVASSASATVIDVDVAASALLGGLTATASATVIPPTPPTPTGSSGGAPKPSFDIRPGDLPIQNVTPRPRTPQLVSAYALSYLTGMEATAIAAITYVAERDDEEVLLLLAQGTRLPVREHRTTSVRRNPRTTRRR